jgi:hypothetical protein
MATENQAILRTLVRYGLSEGTIQSAIRPYQPGYGWNEYFGIAAAAARASAANSGAKLSTDLSEKSEGFMLLKNAMRNARR